jgi:tRNA(His) 5'-end guanylyltransferase
MFQETEQETEIKTIYDFIKETPLWNTVPQELYQQSVKISKKTWDELGDYISQVEKQPIMKVEPNKFITLRFDGNNFSRVLPKLKKAGFIEEGFSQTFATIMQNATKLVMTEFNAIYGFTQSDEITIIIPKCETEGATHIFSGRRDKLETIGACIISQYFTRELCKIKELPDNIRIIFDCRMAVWDTLEDSFQLVLWRSYDCSVNGVSTAVANYGAKKDIRNNNTGVKIKWLEENKKLPLNSHEAYGSFFKKTKKLIQTKNLISGEPVEVMRGCIEQIEGNVINNFREGKITF